MKYQIEYNVQGEMTKEETLQQEKVSFDKFVELFKSNSWYIRPEYKGSFFGNDYDNNYIHAGIWKINNIGLLSKNIEEFKKITKFLNELWVYKNLLGEWNENNKQEELSEKLLSRMIKFANIFSIPLEYKENLGDAAGQINYGKNITTGELILDNTKIEIKNNYKNSFNVIAHELGHYIAILRSRNTSEELANNKAKELCYLFLSEKEQKEFEKILKIYFD
jgi:hypothetical protein